MTLVLIGPDPCLHLTGNFATEDLAFIASRPIRVGGSTGYRMSIRPRNSGSTVIDQFRLKMLEQICSSRDEVHVRLVRDTTSFPPVDIWDGALR